MKRVFALLALAGLSAAVGACGDDDGDDDNTTTDGGTDAGKDSGSTAKTTLGQACTSASTCTGAGTGTVACLTTLGQLPLTGGYCSAACTASSECGASGQCPVGDFASSSIANVQPGATDMLKAQFGEDCLLTCTQGSTCERSGYVCRQLAPAMQQAQLNQAASFVPAIGKYYCLPPLPTAGDAGTGDAGTSALILGGLDAGL